MQKIVQTDHHGKFMPNITTSAPKDIQKVIVKLPQIELVGITCRTNNDQIFKCDPSTNIIAATVQKYFHNELFQKISHRKNPGVTYCVYTNYESDFTGDYTYFIGEAVESFDDAEPEFQKLTIPPQTYAKFTNQPGPMPNVCIEMWKSIFKMTPVDFEGKRSYIADFELYDERSADHQHVILDIYIGIKA